MFLNHARPPWAGLGTWSKCHREPTARKWSTRTTARRARGSGAEAVRLTAGTPSPILKLQAHPPTYSGPLPELFQPTFAVKLDGGALGRAGIPGTHVDSTTLQNTWLASVSLGCSHQHTDPVEGQGEAD